MKFYFYKGRIALYAMLKAFGISTGDQVLLPGYTCVVVPSAVRYLGGTPQYADINLTTYNSMLADYETAYQRLVQGGQDNNLKAVIIQHTYGNPNRDTSAITQWAKEKGFFVIEDCAHANGVVIAGKEAGSFGHGAFFSTQWSKPYTTGLGGIAQINGEEYFGQMEMLEASAQEPSPKESIVLAMQIFAHTYLLRPSIYWFAINTHRYLSKLGLFVGSSSSGELLGEIPPDYFKGMGSLQRKLIQKRQAQMESVNLHRIRLADIYDELLQEKGIQPFKREEGAVLIRYPLLVKDRDECLAAAEAAKIELGDWFNHPLHPAGSSLTGLNWDERVCPKAVKAAQNVINLPLHTRIKHKEAKHIVNFIARYI